MMIRLPAVVLFTLQWWRVDSFMSQPASSASVHTLALTDSKNREMISHHHSHHRHPLPSSSLSASTNPNDLESPEEREERMRLVQQIQKSFYVGEEEGLVVGDMADNAAAVLEQVPLWRVQWTELPGYQNVLNCHVPHYTHMFHRVLSGPRPWLFGHVFLPGGSENLDNPRYRLPDSKEEERSNNAACLTGTLMQVTDYRQLEDGRLAMIVQALERFQVLAATQHVPYAIATIQLQPDKEEHVLRMPGDDDDNDNVIRPNENLEWRDYEFRRTRWEEMEKGGGVSPLVNYDGGYFPNEIAFASLAQEEDDEQASAVAEDIVRIEDLERDVWLALDRMIQLLTQINPGVRIPVPAQLLGLLPIVDENSNNSRDSMISWPADFQLEHHAVTLQRNNAKIGTSTKSPFIRAAENRSYPVARRAARLSYVIWIILDSIVLPGARPPPTRQELLEERSIVNRLNMALKQLEEVNTALRLSQQ